MDHTLQVLMRTRSTTAERANTDAAGLNRDAPGDSAVELACQRDDEGHWICCDSGSSDGWCCVHDD